MNDRDVIHSQIDTERDRQDSMHGTDCHTMHEWLGYLVEEIGEVSKEINEWNFLWTRGGDRHELGIKAKQRVANLREELIQVAATAVAFVEHVDHEDYN